MDGFDEGGRVRAVSKSLELDKEAAVAELGLPVFGSAFFAEIEGVGGLRVVLHSMEVSWMVCSCIKVLGGVALRSSTDPALKYTSGGVWDTREI